MSASTFSLDYFERGDAVTLDDQTTASAYSNTKKLGKMAIGIKFASDAAGVLKILDGTGAARTLEADTYAKGVWHPVKISQIKSTDTTTVNTKFELGYVKY